MAALAGVAGAFLAMAVWIALDDRLRERKVDLVAHEAWALATVLGTDPSGPVRLIDSLSLLSSRLAVRAGRQGQPSVQAIDITLLDRRGVVVASTGRWQRLRGLGDRPEVIRALQGEEGRTVVRRVAYDPGSLEARVAVPCGEGVLLLEAPLGVSRYFSVLVGPAAAIVGGAAILGLLAAFFARLVVEMPARALARWALETSRGGRPKMPELRGSDLQEVARRLQEMRGAMEGNRVSAGMQVLLRDRLLTHLVEAGSLLDEVSAAVRKPQRDLTLLKMETALKKSTRLVSRLMRLAELEALSPAEDLHKVEVEKLVMQVANREARRFAERGVTLEVRGARGLTVRAREDLLTEVLDELVDNAVQKTPTGTTVEVALDVRHGWVHLVVMDRGPGLPEEVLAGLLGASGVHDGLGIPLVREMLRILGGRLHLRNRDHGGLYAEIRLAEGPQSA